MLKKTKKKSLTPKSLAQMGGEATKKKYGVKHYQDMVNKRWENYRKKKEEEKKKK